MANAIDLTTLTAVQAQATIDAADTTTLVPALITAVSRHVLTRTGRRSLNGPASYTDTYAGTGGRQLFLRDSPVTAVASVTVWGVAVPASADGIAAGYVFDDVSLWLVPGTTVGLPPARVLDSRWPRGVRNIVVTYTAGYTGTTTPPSDATFNGAPSDLGQAVTEFVVQQYKRRAWVDQASKVVSAAGETTTFRAWEVPPQLERVIQQYTRRWPV